MQSKSLQTKFHVGDSVRILVKGCPPTGIVVDVLPCKDHPYHVSCSDGLVAWFNQDELRLTSKKQPDWDEECI